MTLIERIEHLEQKAQKALNHYEERPGHLENGRTIWGMFSFSVATLALVKEVAAALKAQEQNDEG